jgi:hypothetical protein
MSEIALDSPKAVEVVSEVASGINMSEIKGGVETLSEVSDAIEKGITYENFSNRIEGILEDAQKVEGMRNAVNEYKELPNSSYNIDGIKYETDDNGKIFKVDGKLQPNDEYKVNSYEYKTDDQGRIIEASGKLNLSGEPRQALNEQDVGGSDKLKTDDRGHVIADIFGGANKIENLVPMDSNLNRGEYKKIENDCVKAKNAGKDVSMQVDIHYTGESKRPSSFTVTHTIDGETFEKTFINKSYKE